MIHAGHARPFLNRSNDPSTLVSLMMVHVV